ncbi:MAG: type II toxin-antitoxin system VapC family toxin, partial [Gemmataceae bacterium]|nr:type II toxin-antitoxin system VapC family toxin [Gemmataceae bacterium]
LDGAVISAVNLAEVLGKMAEYGKPRAVTAAALARLRLPVIPFDEIQAGHVADLREPTRAAGLSLGDRACLALGRVCEAAVLTTDRAWADLEIGVTVEVIR